jgi:hypothetical protein
MFTHLLKNIFLLPSLAIVRNAAVNTKGQSLCGLHWELGLPTEFSSPNALNFLLYYLPVESMAYNCSSTWVNDILKINRCQGLKEIFPSPTRILYWTQMKTFQERLVCLRGRLASNSGEFPHTMLCPSLWEKDLRVLFLGDFNRLELPVWAGVYVIPIWHWEQGPGLEELAWWWKCVSECRVVSPVVHFKADRTETLVPILWLWNLKVTH